MAHAIEIRNIPFDFSSKIAPNWHPQKPEWGHIVNGGSLAMPHLEPFLNRTMREALLLIEDAQLREDVDGFIRQEAQHYTNHRRYNEMLKANGYEELAAVEDTFASDYKELDKRPLARRLAYAAGFETMTMGMTEWFIEDRNDLFCGSDPTVTSLVLWHMVEEAEHKTVAFDVFQALSGSYWLRLVGLLHGTFHVGFLARRGYRAMLKKDGLWYKPSSRIKVWHMVSRFLWRASGAILSSLRPGYHPSERPDPDWADQWRAAYQSRSEEQIPLLNTNTPDIRPDFTSVNQS